MELIKIMALIAIAHQMGAGDIWAIIMAFAAFAFWVVDKITEVGHDN